ncbi:tail fiber assembly protein [Nevskia sp.]|uniref:tail fiber assembly protein n=1 Tax=Nevskia sp. TaxID=1929292 RepID=UPI0025DCA548|nr:tail fiber assembly protein [Nevskia sp.]
MTKYVVMDENGLAIGFYSSDVHGERLIEGSPNPDTRIPPGAVEISDEMHAAWVSNTMGQRLVDGDLVAYTRPVSIPSLAAVRRQRNALLAGSDWTQLPDVPLSVETRAAWAAYRQDLRDVPATLSDPPTAAPTWPTAPA